MNEPTTEKPKEKRTKSGDGIQARRTHSLQFLDPLWNSPTSGMNYIPAGKYYMGDYWWEGTLDEQPIHLFYIDGFYMDRYEVTNQNYAAALNWAWSQGNLIQVSSCTVVGYGTTNYYCETTASGNSYTRITWDGASFGVTPGKEWHPMVEVSWYGAAAYANWRSAMKGRQPSYDTTTWECDFDASGYRLPTEAEWEWATRGGEYDDRFPWGDTLDGSNANYEDSGDPYETGQTEDPPFTTPMGYYNGSQIPAGTDMANSFGLYDMAGNVFEWCNDWYDSGYYGYSPYDNPAGPSSGELRVIRGGSWKSYCDFVVNELRCVGRDCKIPGHLQFDIGFRLALD